MWTGDGAHIAFSSSPDPEQRVRPRIKWKAADGTGEIEALTEAGTTLQLPQGLSPDGSQLVFTELAEDTGWDVWTLDLEGREARPVLDTEYNEDSADLSPDGRWLAFQSDSTGTNEVYVRPFPDVEGGLWQISNGSGQEPNWSPDGR